MFMHNGVVAGFMLIRRKLLATLSDAAYNAVQSFHSDSAVRCSTGPQQAAQGAACCVHELACLMIYWILSHAMFGQPR